MVPHLLGGRFPDGGGRSGGRDGEFVKFDFEDSRNGLHDEAHGLLLALFVFVTDFFVGGGGGVGASDGLPESSELSGSPDFK